MGLAGNDLANGFEIIMFPPVAFTEKEVGEEDQGGEKRQQAECKHSDPF